MATLGDSLSTVGISQATGYQLIAQREQLNATLPQGNGAASVASSDSSSNTAKPSSTAASGPKQLTPEQQRAVQSLRQIDQAVRAHEQAHISAGRGVVTSGPVYTYTYGPDGKQYAVGGEVGIDTSPESKPQANIDKGQRIQVAALAPREPSPQDFRVASVGSQLEAQGRADLAQQQAAQSEPATQANRQQLARAYSAGGGDNNHVASATLSVFA
ncbi:MAG: hypothetical protein HY066_12260 [Betaproteobacteria bacterium]|nr:hypothetical protein [Betaproteobacteria bacterium]